MRLDRHKCASGPYVWLAPEVPLHCQDLVDLVMNSWLAHNLKRAW
jgi:hypothetical protein